MIQNFAATIEILNLYEPKTLREVTVTSVMTLKTCHRKNGGLECVPLNWSDYISNF